MRYIKAKYCEDYNPGQQVHTGSGELVGFMYGTYDGANKPVCFGLYDGTSSSGTLLIKINSGYSGTVQQGTPSQVVFPDNTSIKFSTGLFFEAILDSGANVAPNTFTAFLST